ncbi:hypothetical protein VSS74_01350 [Conexibacter stalactiti]|uniref:Uncharacterized protein n=1 Tax=Conexibacter stalactiti TaxID=1940611 RepID=A0ABU4HI25_9ACTN|nr:hypothetical protein [Conexibacter stalactiti]MDW5592963.1 hypothetical protein [Conexibacter stalactiti]MEC5033604.1 hypothetical protein [Conexibacter stalactiti]
MRVRFAQGDDDGWSEWYELEVVPRIGESVSLDDPDHCAVVEDVVHAIDGATHVATVTLKTAKPRTGRALFA